MDNNKGAKVRLSKLMSERGLSSRREADAWIEKGWVFVNGEKITELGTKVTPSVQIELDPLAKSQQAEKLTIILNKPIGYLSGPRDKEYLSSFELLTPNRYFKSQKARPPRNLDLRPLQFQGLAIAGRLDIESKGLLVFTNDGRVAKQLIEKDKMVEKEYLVRFSGQLNPEKLQLLRHGLFLDEYQLREAQVEEIEPGLLKMILIEGKKRQIRRMLEQVELKTVSLKRVRIGQIPLGGLPEGLWRNLAENEVFRSDAT